MMMYQVVADVFDAAGQELLDELKLLDETATGIERW